LSQKIALIMRLASTPIIGPTWPTRNGSMIFEPFTGLQPTHYFSSYGYPFLGAVTDWIDKSFFLKQQREK